MLYVKTEAGRGQLQARTLSLTPAQRQVLILCDGERHLEDLMEMMPAETLRVALGELCDKRLLQSRDMAPRPAKAQPVELDEAERYRAIVELATSMATELGFAARVRAQLQIEKAQTMQDLTGVIDILCKHLKATPLMQLRLQKLKQLAAH